jgi:NSS family neurotransmitter:Na+ symporter
MASRARFATKIGFILSGIGSAVGLGNIWRFPQVTSQNGGAAFLILYAPLVIFIGIPLLWAELAAGQRGQGAAPQAIDNIVGGKWKWVGVLMVVTSTLFLGYYAVIAGISLKYAIFAPTDAIASDPGSFLAVTEEGPQALLMASIFTAIAVGIVSGGVSGGIERANLVMMPLLFAIVLGLAIYGLTQPGAGAGLDFYLGFSPSDLTFDAATIALGQVFFSTSVGFGIMITYGSYNDEGKSLLGSASIIGISDMVVALVAGLMIFPLVFSEGLQQAVIDPDASITTALFLTLPSAFASIGGVLGKALMLVFFFMLTMAALSSSISGLEVIVSYLTDLFDVARWKLTLLTAEITFGLGILSALSVEFLGSIDALVGSVLLILGGIGVCLLYTFGLEDNDARVEMLLGGEEDPAPWMESTTRVVASLVAYVIPVILIFVFLVNLDNTCVSVLGDDACGPLTDVYNQIGAAVAAVL